MTNFSAGVVSRLQRPLKKGACQRAQTRIAAIRHSGLVVLWALAIRHPSFMFVGFHSEVETGFRLKALWYLDRVPLLQDEVTQA